MKRITKSGAKKMLKLGQYLGFFVLEMNNFIHVTQLLYYKIR